MSKNNSNHVGEGQEGPAVRRETLQPVMSEVCGGVGVGGEKGQVTHKSFILRNYYLKKSANGVTATARMLNESQPPGCVDVCACTCVHARARMHVYACAFVYVCACVCAVRACVSVLVCGNTQLPGGSCSSQRAGESISHSSEPFDFIV